LKGWFTIDIVASLPIDLVQRIVDKRFECSLNAPSNCAADTQVDDGNGNLIRMVKLIRMFRLVKMLRLVRIQRLLNRYQDELFVYMGCINICKIVTMLFFVGHILGCFFFFFSTEDWRTTDEVDLLGSWRDGGGSWIEANFEFDGNGTITSPVMDKYITAQYWAFTTMTTVGYGDISARTQVERAYAIVGMVVGGLTFSVLVGSMSSMMGADVSKAAQSEKMNLVTAYVRDCKMDRDLRLRVLQFFRRQNVKGYSERDFLQELPSQEREDVVMHCYGALLRKLPLFCTFETNHTMKSFVIEILQNVATKAIASGTVIVHEGEEPTALFLCTSGVIGIDRDDDGDLDHKLTAPTFFGEDSLLGATKNIFTFTAITQCDFLELHNDDVIIVLQRYPGIEAQFADLWKRRVPHFRGQSLEEIEAAEEKASNEAKETQAHIPPKTTLPPLSMPSCLASDSVSFDGTAMQRVEQLEAHMKKRFDAIDAQLHQIVAKFSHTHKNN